jgi:acetolactate synthase regulatory subunit
MEHLRHRGFHARALAGGQNDDMTVGHDYLV